MKKLFFFLFMAMLASCKTSNILMEPASANHSTIDTLDSVFRFNNHYEYRIRKNDKLNISVWGQDELSVGSVYGIYNSNEVYGKWLMVDQKGNIEIPKMGTVYVLDYTLVALKDTLKRSFAKWIVNPVVDIKILNKEISVVGEVRNPQVFVIDKDHNTLLEMISRSGGFEFYANVKNIKVLRQYGDSVKIAHIDMSKSGNYADKNIQLFPGDVVVVPSKKNKEFDKRVSIIIPFSTVISALAIVYKLF